MVSSYVCISVQTSLPQIWELKTKLEILTGVSLFASIPYQGFLRLKVSINCNKLKTHSPV